MKFALATLAAVSICASALPTTVEARGLEIGWLDCVIGKAGRLEVFLSNRDVSCTYTPLGGLSRPEHYVGTFRKLV